MPSTGSTSSCHGTGLLRWSVVNWRHECRHHRPSQDHPRRGQARGSAPHRGAFDIRLDRLHLAIQAAMGWTNTHLYEIRARDVGWSTPDADADWSHDFLDAR